MRGLLPLFCEKRPDGAYKASMARVAFWLSFLGMWQLLFLCFIPIISQETKDLYVSILPLIVTQQGTLLIYAGHTKRVRQPKDGE